MKKLSLLVIGVLSMSNLVAQDISDAVRYSLDEIHEFLINFDFFKY